MSLGFGWLKPQIALALDRYYWFHERHWHMFGLTQLAAPFAGTPFKNIFSRLEGVRMGKKVFDDGVRWTEYTLMEIGDYTNLNVALDRLAAFPRRGRLQVRPHQDRLGLHASLRLPRSLRRDDGRSRRARGRTPT